MLESPDAVGEVINIGPDEEFVSINTLYEVIAELVGFSGKPVYMPERPQEVREATCSADKARRLLGYRPQVDLRTGLNAMIEHIRRRGPKPFDYHIEIEIENHLTPRSWRERLF